MNTELDILKITTDPAYIDGEAGIDQVAFTKNPAVKVKGFAFNSHEVKRISFADAPKMRIVAPAMIPMNIYRNDEFGEYYVQFTAEEIENLHKAFMKDLNNKQLFNLEHDSNKIAPAYILEAWLVGKDPKADRSYSEFGIEVPTGTLMMTAQITDQNYYNALVREDQTGFSVEGLFGLKFTENKKTPMKQTFSLPDGEHKIEDKIYMVKDGEIVDVKEVEAEEVKEEKVEEVEVEAEEVKEEVEEVKVEAQEVPDIDEAAILTILQPKLDEIYAKIAELQAQMQQEKVEEEVEETEIQMSVHQKFTEAIKFMSK